MALSRLNQRYLKLFPTGCKILSCYFSRMPLLESPYWHEIFPDKKIRSFDEIPTVGPSFRKNKKLKISESYQRWSNEIGHVVKELFDDDDCCIHVYHDDDFHTVYQSGGECPLWRGHEAISKYRLVVQHVSHRVPLTDGVGAEWAHLRRMLPKGVAPDLYTPFQPQLEDVVDDFMDLVKSKLNENSEVEILPLLFRWALESIGLITVNRRLGALSHRNEVAEILIEAVYSTYEMIHIRSAGEIDKEVEKAFIHTHICKRYADEIMKHIYKAALERGPCLTGTLVRGHYVYDYIVTLILDIFQGAIFTVPFALTWALYQVARCPEIKERARKDLMQMMPTRHARFYDPSITPDKQTLRIQQSVRYVGAIIAESLRLNPPIICNQRITDKDLVLGGYLVPAGNVIVLQNQAACRLEKYFERPLEFIPDRYLDYQKYYRMGSVDNAFGSGIASCMGRSFAKSQMNLCLSKILRNFEVSYHHEEVGAINSLLNIPDRPLILKMVPLTQ